MARQAPGIEVREGKRGNVYRVRYSDHANRRRSKSFDTRADALAFQAQVRLAARSGSLAAMDAGQQPLRDVAQAWWTDYAEPSLTATTRKAYATVWNLHALPRLGDVPVRALDAPTVFAFDAQLAADGVGPEARRKTLVVLQAIMRYAVLTGIAASNPVGAVRKPGGKRQHVVLPLAPAAIEQLVNNLRDDERPGGATMVVAMAYGGFRPQEVLALTYADVRERTVLVKAKNVDGQIEIAGKHSSHRARSVTLLGALRDDLARWRRESGNPPDDALLFANATGEPWQVHDWKNWRRRAFKPAAIAAGLSPKFRPYDLRHTYASLLIASGRSVVDVAAQLGHSPATTLRTYAHVIPEIHGTIDGDLDAYIAEARQQPVEVTKMPSRRAVATTPT